MKDAFKKPSNYRTIGNKTGGKVSIHVPFTKSEN
jgi:hypothetical protein